jgi:hypothetical protein
MRTRREKQLKLDGLDFQNIVVHGSGDTISMAEQKLKLIVRSISKTGMITAEGAVPVQEVETYVSAFLAEGFRVLNAVYMGETPEFITMLFVLVKD